MNVNARAALDVVAVIKHKSHSFGPPPRQEPPSKPKKEPPSKPKPKPKKNRPRNRKERAVEWDQQKQHWLLLGCDCDGVVLCNKMATNESPWLAGLVSQSEKVGVPLSLWTRQWVCQSEKVGMPK
jgi:hypothetical protein